MQHTGHLAFRVVFLLLLAWGFGSSTVAATFKVHCTSEDQARGNCSIVMQGKIEKGDSERLVQALKSPLAQSTFFRTLVLNSPGGEVQAAFELADVIVKAVLTTQTFSDLSGYRREDSICVSACFLVWVAGAERYELGMYLRSTGSQIGLGLHRPYFSPETYAKLPPAAAQQYQQDLAARVRSYLKRYDVPDALIDQMMSRSSKDVFWLKTLEDPLAERLSGKSAWFEELMIAQCNFDPVYDSESSQRVFKDAMKKIVVSPATTKYLGWLRTYGTCAAAYRKSAQKQFLASK